MLTGEDDFIKGLKSNPDQDALISALFNDPAFKKLWDYLKRCPNITVNLKATPGLTDKGGVTRYGQYTPGAPPGSGTLELNPTKPEHLSNPAELVDTLAHELIHALCAAKDACPDLPWPLPPGAWDWSHDPDVPNPSGHPPQKGLPKTRNRAYADEHYGDGASDPVHEYLDENDIAQQFIVDLVNAALKTTAGAAPDYKLKGKPTATHHNLKKMKKLSGRKWTKNWQKIRAITWEPDACWVRTSTPRGWISKCNCTTCEMIVKYDDGTLQIDIMDNGDSAELNGNSLSFDRIAGWETK